MWVVALVLVVGTYGKPAGDRGGQVSWAWLGGEFNTPLLHPFPTVRASTLGSKARASSWCLLRLSPDCCAREK